MVIMSTTEEGVVEDESCAKHRYSEGVSLMRVQNTGHSRDNAWQLVAAWAAAALGGRTCGDALGQGQ